MFRKYLYPAGKHPDFICIGMQKAGTAFLYDCLNNLDGFMLPVLRELHHFDCRGDHPPGIRRLLKGVARQLGQNKKTDKALLRFYQSITPEAWCENEWIELANRRIRADQITLEFMQKLSLYVVRGGLDKDYLKLFSPYKDYITGDITPGYSGLDSDQIKQVKSLLPYTRIILCAREPVARLWSQLNMWMRRILHEQYNRPLTQDDAEDFDAALNVEQIREFLALPRFVDRSFPSPVLQRWTDVYGEERMLVINFEDLTAKTEQVLDQVCRFIGSPRLAEKSIPPNKKEDRLKIDLDTTRREVLEEFLGDELRLYQQTFDRYKDRV